MIRTDERCSDRQGSRFLTARRDEGDVSRRHEVEELCSLCKNKGWC